MKYASLRRREKGRQVTAGLCGGLNRRDLPFAAADDQLTDCRNLWWREGALRTRPALRVIATTKGSGERVYAPNPDGRYVMRQSEGTLTTGVIDAVGGTLWNSEAQDAPDGGWRVRYDVSRLDGWTAGDGDGTILFLADGQVVAPLATGGYAPLDDFLYVPQLLIDGVGMPSLAQVAPKKEPYEPPNLLTRAFRAAFTTDGEGKMFYLPVARLDLQHPIIATYQDENGNVFTHTIESGVALEAQAQADGLRMAVLRYRRCIVFYSKEAETIMCAPPSAGVANNLVVTAVAAASEEPAAVIGGMKFGCWFGGEDGSRLFAAGNPACPHRIYWSDADRPLYFPQDNCAVAGDAAQAVTAFGKQEERLVVFKEREMYALELDGAAALLTPIHGEIGCDCPATVQFCQNRLVWLTGEGRVYTLVSGGSYRSWQVVCVSGTVEPLLRGEALEVLQRASAGCYDGWYCLLVGREMLLLRSDDGAFARAASHTAGDTVWYRWTFDEAVKPERLLTFGINLVMMDAVGRGYLFGGDEDTVMTENGYEKREIPCELRTKLFDFGHPDRRKTVRRLAFSFGALRDGTLTARYVTDQGERCDYRRFVVASKDERAADFLQSGVLTPHAARVRRFGLELSATAAAAFGPLCIWYDIDNVTDKGVG